MCICLYLISNDVSPLKINRPAYFFCEDFIDEKTIGVDSGIDEGEWGGGGVFPTGLAKNT